MRAVLDLETSVTWRENAKGKSVIFNDPYEKDNSLTQFGLVNVDNTDEMHIINLDHNEEKDVDGSGRAFIQALLDKTTLLIIHNAKFDMMWLWECGFVYDGPVYDTMLAEYLLDRGQRNPVGLGAAAERRGLAEQKEDYLSTCLKKGINTNETDLASLSLYLRADLLTTTELFHQQERDFAEADSQSLHNVRQVTFDTCKTLTQMYMSGVKVDLDVLDEVRQEFEHERATIETRLQDKIRDLMGDTPINLRSSEQKSKVIFSREMNNKKDWKGLFTFVKDAKEFKKTVEANSTLIRKTEAFTCPTCEGQGKTFKVKKDGTKYAKPNKCKDCDARGYQLRKTNKMAGLGFFPPNKDWASDNGFNTGKKELDVLIATAKNNNMQDAIDLLTDMKRLNAVNSYISNFVNAIELHTKENGILHVNLTQHITATGRFSGRDPNMQNMPRGNTFPVKKVFVSRWDGGYIMEADFAQLEFRTAAFLAQDEVAMEEIATGFDVHSYTAKVITDAGQHTTRQEAKEHTFAPLFGATGFGRSKAEKAYYEHFTEKYKGVAAWHQNLAEEALRFNKITNISGRQYAFPDVERRANGGVSHFTNIKNYPVQGFATGDVVPVVLNEMHKRLQPYYSCIVNTVHDSVVVDIHPDEKDIVLQLVNDMNDGLTDMVEKVYGIRMNVPLLLEAKIGPNWLDTVDV
jgi:DNA polymerase I-like protein with 3'-5' exonuclease and polymerase domains